MTDLLIRRLTEPPFGTETSERNLMAEAARALLDARAELARARADAQAAAPVAWKYRWKIDGEYVGWRYSDASNAHPSLDGYEEQPLYSAPVDLLRADAVDIVRSVWGRCEALEDEAADKLAQLDKLTDHEKGFWRGQKTVAKSIRRSTEMPTAEAIAIRRAEGGKA